MKTKKIIGVALAIAVCCGMASSAYAGFIAYNDSGRPWDDSGNNEAVTYWSIPGGGTNPSNNTVASGLLKDYPTWNPAAPTYTGVTLTCTNIAGAYSGWNDGYDFDGGDGAAIFGGITGLSVVGQQYMANWGSMRTTFTGLTPGATYEVVLTGNRNSGSGYWNRITRWTLEDTDSSTQASSTGSTMTPLTTDIITGSGNGALGYVARWTDIVAGANNSFSVLAASVGSDSTSYGTAVLKLVETDGNGEVPEPAGLGLVGLALLAVRKRRS